MQTLKNFAVSTLNGSINNSVTTITLTNGNLFPSIGEYYIKIENEIIKVTNRSSNDLTVVRAQDGTTAVSHSHGVEVNLVISASTLDGLRKDNFDNGSASSFTTNIDGAGRLFAPSDRPNLLYDDGITIRGIGPIHQLVKAQSANFTLFNGTGATVTDIGGGILFESPVGATQDMKMLEKNILSSPFTIKIKLDVNRYDRYNAIGLYFRDSVSARIHAIQFVTGGATAPYLEIIKFSSPTVYDSSSEFGTYWDMTPWPNWLQIRYDATNVYFDYSNNGLRFRQLGQATKNSWLTNNPDKIGWFVISTNATYPAIAFLSSWQELATATLNP